MDRSNYISNNVEDNDDKSNPTFSVRLDLKDLASIAKYLEEELDMRITTRSQLIQGGLGFFAEKIENLGITRFSTDEQARQYLEDDLRIPMITNKQQKETLKKKARNEKLDIGRGKISEQTKTMATAFHMREQQIANNFTGTAKEFEQRMYDLIDESPIEWEEYITLYPTREFDDFIGAGRTTETQKRPTPKITPSAPDAPDLSPDALKGGNAKKESRNTNSSPNEKNVHENEQTGEGENNGN